ncbi:MAG: hypothetical protein E6Q97_39605 [Desulfurellales bacterium]|nr:MAG: hypothetical protein E6Q97_39605 [Desulfurellales bacterium]
MQQIDLFAARIEDRAGRLEAEAKRYRDTLERADAEVRRARQELAKVRSVSRDGGRWVDVRRVELKIGRAYFARRSWGRKFPPAEPCLAEWTSSGWREIYGHITQSTASFADLQVWVPK